MARCGTGAKKSGCAPKADKAETATKATKKAPKKK